MEEKNTQEEEIKVQTNVENADLQGNGTENSPENADVVKKENVFKKLWSKIVKFKNEHKIKFYVILSIVLAVIVATISISIPVSINVNRNNLYNDLVYEMEHFNTNSVYEIDTLLEKLPENYKNVGNIEAQYKIIKKHATTLSECSSIRSWSYNEGSGDKIREAYIQLKKLSPGYLDWNIEGFLDSIRIELLLFDAEWGNYSYSFEWNYYEDLFDERLTTDIPNNKETGKEYYFTADKFADYIIFGYENKADSKDKFDAFKVSNLRYTNSNFYVDVYCYKNSMKYTFSLVV